MTTRRQRRSLRVIRLMVGWAFLVLARVSAAEPPPGQRPFADFLKATTTEPATSERLWTALVESDFVIDSERADRRGRFDLVIAGGPKGSYVRLMADANASGAHLLALDSRNLPYAAWLRGTLFRHDDDEAGWLRESGDWGFVADKDHTTEYIDPTVVHKGAGVVRFDLGGFLREAFRDPADDERTPAVRWIKATRTLLVDKGNGAQAAIQFRTPNDQQLLGTPLADVNLLSSNGVFLRFTNFKTSDDAILRIQPTDLDAVQKALDAKTHAVEQASFRLNPRPVAGTAESSMRLISELLPVTLLDARPPARPELTALGTAYRESLFLLTKNWEQTMLPLTTREEVPGEWAGIELKLFAETGIALMNGDLILTGGQSLRYLDDPTLVWTGFEMATSPPLAKQFVERVMMPVIHAKIVPLPVRVSMTQLCGRLGRPPWMMAAETDSTDEGVRLCHAILKAHWGFNLTDDDVTVCAAHCSHEQLVVRNAAVLTLVLSGHIDRAPPSDLDAWFDRQSNEPAANAVAQWRQQEFLNQLSAHASGREYLLERLKADDASPVLSRDIAQLLLVRIAAARRLQRHDFLSVQESNTILHVLESKEEFLKSAATE